MTTSAEQKTRSEETFSYDEYLRRYAPEKQENDLYEDDVEVVATAMANESLDILRAGIGQH